MSECLWIKMHNTFALPQIPTFLQAAIVDPMTRANTADPLMNSTFVKNPRAKFKFYDMFSTWYYDTT